MSCYPFLLNSWLAPMNVAYTLLASIAIINFAIDTFWYTIGAEVNCNLLWMIWEYWILFRFSRYLRYLTNDLYIFIGYCRLRTLWLSFEFFIPLLRKTALCYCWNDLLFLWTWFWFIFKVKLLLMDAFPAKSSAIKAHVVLAMMTHEVGYSCYTNFAKITAVSLGQ